MHRYRIELFFGGGGILAALKCSLSTIKRLNVILGTILKSTNEIFKKIVVNAWNFSEMSEVIDTVCL